MTSNSEQQPQTCSQIHKIVAFQSLIWNLPAQAEHAEIVEVHNPIIIKITFACVKPILTEYNKVNHINVPISIEVG